jgi:hypothetical protein
MLKYLVLFIFISGLFNSVSADDITYNITVGRDDFKSLSSECSINEQKTVSGPTQEEDKFILILNCLEKMPKQPKKYKSIGMVLISNQKELDQFLQNDNPVLSFERILPFIDTQEIYNSDGEISYESLPKLNQGEAALFIRSDNFVSKTTKEVSDSGVVISVDSLKLISACYTSTLSFYPNSILVNKTETDAISLNFSFESRIPSPIIILNKLLFRGKARSLQLSLDITPNQE